MAIVARPFPSPAITPAESNPYGLLLWFVWALNPNPNPGEPAYCNGAGIAPDCVVRIGPGDYWVTPGTRYAIEEFVLMVSIIWPPEDNTPLRHVNAIAQLDGTVRVKTYDGTNAPTDARFSLAAFRVDAPLVRPPPPR